MTKNEFLKRLLLSDALGEVPDDDIKRVFVAVFDEIKEVVREGDELHLNNFGKFYPKEMQSRVVRGGWYQSEKKEYFVPKKTKIGFSSFPTVDEYVSCGSDDITYEFNPDLFDI